MWFQRCPTSQWEPWVGEFLRSLAHYDAGYLPVAGGTQDQARAWLEALRVSLPHRRECEHAAAQRSAKNHA